jgi:hypothetical protein
VSDTSRSLENQQIALLAGLSPLEVLPGFAAAFDVEAMKGYLQIALFGADRPRYVVERCTPIRPLYIPGECCIVRYEVEARNSTSGELLEPIVKGRVFPDQSTCAVYMREKLAPLAARMRGRPEVAAFAAPAALIAPLNVVVHVWPIDGELPTLVEATDRERMLEIFRGILPEMLQQQFLVEDCRIELVSYRRRQRCVLRYTIAGKEAGSDDVRRLVVYGKLTALGNEELTSRTIDALHDHIRQRGAGYRFTLPRSFGWRQELRLALLEAVPGKEQIRLALKARLRGRPPPPDAAPLEEMIATCGYVAATLHTSGLELGPSRTLDDDIAGLRREIAIARQFAPEFGDRAQSWLERIAALAEQSEPTQPCLSHGDFQYGQLLFDGARCGLVDLDTICQAEPALDLGKFLAHLRFKAEQVLRRASMSSALGEQLAEHFLHAYIGARGDQAVDERQLRLRATLYEGTTLLRLAVRGQLNLDEARRDIASAVLERRVPQPPRSLDT